MRVTVNEVSSQLKFHIFLFIYFCDSVITTSQLVGGSKILSCHYFVNTAKNLHLLIFLTFLRIQFLFVISLINYTKNEILGPI